MEVNITISRGKVGRYQANMDFYEELPFGLYGEGETVEETIEEVRVSYDEMKSLFSDEGKEFPEDVEFNFVYDEASFPETV